MFTSVQQKNLFQHDVYKMIARFHQVIDRIFERNRTILRLLTRIMMELVLSSRKGFMFSRAIN